MKNARIIELTTVDSTNLYAERLLNTGKASDGTIIWAHEQTAGKGQGTNRWESEPGKNLTFSVILLPEWLPVDRQFNLNKAITLGVLDLLGSLVDSKDLFIKWPNDIYWKCFKLGGILINHMISGSVLGASVVGIGLNINQDSFSKSLPNPVSLKMITGEDSGLRMILSRLIAALDSRLIQLRRHHGDISKDYREKLLGYNAFRNYTQGEVTVHGKILDVDEFGRLLMELACGQVVGYSHGEITFQ